MLKKLIPIFLLSCAAAAATCPPDNVCSIYLGVVSVNYGSAIWSDDLGASIVPIVNNLLPGVAANGPENTGYSKYVVRATTSNVNPLQIITDCGCNARNELREWLWVPQSPISETAQDITVVQQNGKAINANNTWPDTGMLYMEDEAASFHRTAGGQIGDTFVTLHLDQRGMWQTIGFLAAYAHGTTGGRTGKGAEVNLLCPSGPHAPSYHTSNNPHIAGHSLVVDGGTWQETWTNGVHWSLDLTNIGAGWQYFPAYSAGPFPLGYQEGSTVTDPDHDADYYFGGLRGNPTSDLLVRCNSLPATAFGCNGQVGKWIKIVAAGDPGPRDGIRGVWNPILHMIMFFMGNGNGVNTRTVAFLDTTAGKWYVNEAGFGASAPGSPIPPMTGPPPADNVIANKWPAVACNWNRGVCTFFDGTNYPYDLDTVHNIWTKWTAPLTLPAVPDANAWNGRSATFDPNTNVYTLFEHTKGIFQYPDLMVGGLSLTVPESCNIAYKDVPYSCQLVPHGGVAPYLCSMDEGQPPTGTSLNPASCLVSGIPTEENTFNGKFGVDDHMN